VIPKNENKSNKHLQTQTLSKKIEKRTNTKDKTIKNTIKTIKTISAASSPAQFVVRKNI